VSTKKVKTPAKIFNSDLAQLENMVVKAINKIDRIVGSSLGPGGRNVIIESELPGIPNKNTKDGVTIFRSLGSNDAFEHLIIEQTRDVAIRTVNEAGDGTTTATVIASALIKNLFHFCSNNRKYSPQKVTREINQLLETKLLPELRAAAIKITTKNQDLLERVATISANGDKEMAKAVIDAFEKVGYGSSSHVTIQELSGPGGYEATLIEGFPIDKGYEESIGKFHSAFINDQGFQRCTLDNPLFVLFDGNITDVVQVQDLLNNIGQEYVSGKSEFKNVVIVAHRFSDTVLNNFAFNFSNPNTINVVPLQTPMFPMVNGQLQFLMDMAAFTGARIFNMTNPLADATPEDLGKDMTKIEINRFRTTITGTPDPTNVEVRAEEIKSYISQAESIIEKKILEERLGKLTSGIALLKIYGSSNGELKEKADRAEDAVCAVRAAINHGCLPGGCRVLINLALGLTEDKSKVVQEVVIPSLFAPFHRLLENAGYNEDEVKDILTKMITKTTYVFDVENATFSDFKKAGVYDAASAVEQALKNAVSISSVMGTLGGIVAFPRDHQLENQEAKAQADFNRTINNAQALAEESKIVVDQELIENYARIKGVSHEVARQKLEENMTKEANVDLRQQMTTLMKAFRTMSPQLTGVIQRENDYALGIKSLERQFNRLEKNFEDLISRLEFERETYKKAMEILNGIVAVDKNTMDRIAKLEASSEPLYKRVWNKIKCLLNN
jgi:chaperonin GroEL